MIFNVNSIWNRPIGASPVILTAYNSFLAQLGDIDIIGVTIGGNSSPPIFDAAQDTPLVPFTNSRGVVQQIPLPSGSRSDSGSDGKCLIRSNYEGRAYSFYRYNVPNRSCEAGGWSDITPIGDGITCYWGTGGGWGGRATGWNYIAGLIMLAEIQAGRIDHAIAFSITRALAHSTSYVWPAKATDGGSTNPASLPEGVRLQLDPALNLESLGLSPAAKIIARAMQEYGLYLCDVGGQEAIHCQEFLIPGADLDPAPWLAVGIDWNSAHPIPATSFRAVQVLPGDFYPLYVPAPIPPPDPVPPPVPVPTGPLVVGDWATNLAGTLAPVKVISVGSTKIQVLAVSGATLIRRELTKALYKRATPSAGQIATWATVLHGLWPEIV